MKGILIVLILLGLAAGTGCDGDGDGQQTSQATPSDTDAAEDGDEVVKPEVLLAQGDAIVGIKGGKVLCTVYPPEAGTLRGTLIWTSPPDELSALFHNAVGHARATGTSPVTSEYHVSKAWEPWNFNAANESDKNASVHYVVMFRPD